MAGRFAYFSTSYPPCAQYFSTSCPPCTREPEASLGECWPPRLLDAFALSVDASFAAKATAGMPKFEDVLSLASAGASLPLQVRSVTSPPTGGCCVPGSGTRPWPCASANFSTVVATSRLAVPPHDGGVAALGWFVVQPSTVGERWGVRCARARLPFEKVTRPTSLPIIQTSTTRRGPHPIARLNSLSRLLG